MRLCVRFYDARIKADDDDDDNNDAANLLKYANNGTVFCFCCCMGFPLSLLKAFNFYLCYGVNGIITTKANKHMQNILRHKQHLK